VYLKTHLSGEAIVYDSKGGGKKNIVPSPGREQGSLINQQKRKIADACEYLRLHLQSSPDRCAFIFCLTSPGYRLETAKVVSKFFDNVRSNYALGEYVWVREVSPKGMVHFHCVADWYKPAWFFEIDENARNNFVSSAGAVKPLNRAGELSNYWASLFGVQSNNLFRMGGYWNKKRIYSLRSKTQVRYLCKYLGKQFERKNVNPVTFSGPTRFATHLNLFGHAQCESLQSVNTSRGSLPLPSSNQLLTPSPLMTVTQSNSLEL